MKYDWFLFDLDGTLTESGEGIMKSAAYALEKMGREPLNEDVLRTFIGPPLLTSMMERAKMTEEEAERAVKIYRERYSEIGWKENRVYPFIAQLLRGIKRRGGHIALVTAKPEPYSVKIADYFGLSKYLDVISAVTLSQNSSDKEALIARALPEDLPRERAVMVGDRIFDREGALKSGTGFAGALYGYGSEKELSGCANAETPKDLWELLIGGRPDRGEFITFEGADGSGKSTQYELSYEYLTRMGFMIARTREPGGCYISEKIRALLLDTANEGMTPVTEALLYAASRAQHLHDTVLPALDRGEMVLCDRYLDSSIAYQGYGRELTEALVRQINMPATGGLESDMTLLYMLPASDAHKRVLSHSTPDRLEKEGLDFTDRLNRGYMELAKENSRIRTINARGDIQTVFAETKRVLDAYLGI